MEELAGRLEILRKDERMARAIVLLKADVGTTVGMERAVAEIVLREGFRLALVGKGENRETGDETEEGEAE